jgi:hypothetical protein
VYYQPAFYGWINSPWQMAISFNWGPPVWGAYYGAYFTPYPSYPTADLWLTDYVVNANLQQAYAEQQAVNGNSPGYPTAAPDYSAAEPDQAEPYPSNSSPLSSTSGQQQLAPDVKTLLSQQIHSRVAQLETVSATVSDGSGASVGYTEDAVPESLKPGNAAFLVSTDMQLDVADDQSCALTPADALFRTTSTPDADGKVQVVVVGTKQGDCELNTKGTLSVAALEEMNNQFDQQIDAGIEIVKAKSGNGGFPAAPATTATKLQLASAQQPDQDANSLLQQNQIAGQQAETELANAAKSGN